MSFKKMKIIIEKWICHSNKGNSYFIFKIGIQLSLMENEYLTRP